MAPPRAFEHRSDAGRRLAAVVDGLGPEGLVLGLARGGVPVAAELARAHGVALDVLVVRKVGHPAQPEYALGAVSEDGVVWGEELPGEEVAAQLERAGVQALALRRGRPRAPVAGRAVVLVDDGLATGQSMLAAVRSVVGAGAATVRVAVPVASGPGLAAVAALCPAEAVLVVEPPDFHAVGQFYDDFTQVEDETVAGLLAGDAGPEQHR